MGWRSSWRCNAWRGGAAFLTIDRTAGLIDRLDVLERLGAEVWELDLFSDAGYAALAERMSAAEHPVVLFCDGGDRRREALASLREIVRPQRDRYPN